MVIHNQRSHQSRHLAQDVYSNTAGQHVVYKRKYSQQAFTSSAHSDLFSIVFTLNTSGLDLSPIFISRVPNMKPIAAVLISMALSLVAAVPVSKCEQANSLPPGLDYADTLVDPAKRSTVIRDVSPYSGVAVLPSLGGALTVFLSIQELEKRAVDVDRVSAFEWTW